MKQEDKELLAPYLQSGEELLWAGRPNPEKLFGPGDLMAVIGGLMVFSCLLFTAVYMSMEMPTVGIWAARLMLVVVLLVMLVIAKSMSSFLRSLKQDRRTTVYGVTKNHLVFLWHSGSASSASVVVQLSPQLEIKQRGDSIEFRDLRPMAPGDESRPASTVTLFGIRDRTAFIDIEDCDKVKKLIEKQAKKL